MAIKKIKVTNFKSFKKLEIDLGKFNVLIGANASGKSNFVQVFRFLRDIQEFGLNNAISMQGGVAYLRNINLGPSENLEISIVSDKEFKLGRRIKKGTFIGIKIYETSYNFTLGFKKRGQGFHIVNDELIQKCNFFNLEKQPKELKEKEEIGNGEILCYRSNGKGKINVELKMPEGIPIKKEDIFPRFLMEEKFPSDMLLLQTPFFFVHPVEESFSYISIYDFDPKLPKKATPITGKADLEEDGANLSIVLNNIIKDKNRKRKLFNLITELLPFIDNIDIEKFADKSLLFKLQEKYFKKQYLPASLISDGTINITAILIALYFEKKSLTIIEEPERNIHPHLISKIVNIMKDASGEKQIIVTTHNPEIVKYTNLENILLISRDKEGFSRISRPVEKEEIKIFLKNEIGIEELYVQNLLEV